MTEIRWNPERGEWQYRRAAWGPLNPEAAWEEDEGDRAARDAELIFGEPAKVVTYREDEYEDACYREGA